MSSVISTFEDILNVEESSSSLPCVRLLEISDTISVDEVSDCSSPSIKEKDVDPIVMILHSDDIGRIAPMYNSASAADETIDIDLLKYIEYGYHPNGFSTKDAIFTVFDKLRDVPENVIELVSTIEDIWIVDVKEDMIPSVNDAFAEDDILQLLDSKCSFPVKVIDCDVMTEDIAHWEVKDSSTPIINNEGKT